MENPKGVRQDIGYDFVQTMFKMTKEQEQSSSTTERSAAEVR